VIALSLPTVAANRAVVLEIAEAGHSGSTVVDTCTIGAEAAAENARILAAVGIDYVDSPVSGMKVKAEEGTLTSMTACSVEALERARPLIMGYSRVVYHVGTAAGQGQSMKVVNNSLYISALVTTSETLCYGENSGLNMNTMLEVINASSGQNVATTMMFPFHVATGTYSGAGAEAHIVKKDLGLFVDASAADGTPNAAIAKAYEIIEAFSEEDPLQDMARIYPFVKALNRGG
jgi:3-hydroxyisobutyrate dehydrogenase-like beta-hydroxyacid dehydrogenase